MPQKREVASQPSEFDAAIRARMVETARLLHSRNLDDDLTPEQGLKLARIVLRFTAAFQLFAFVEDKGSSRSTVEAQERMTNHDLREDREHGASQRRVFSRKLKTAIAAVENALAYATDDSKTRVYAHQLQTAVKMLLRAKDELDGALRWNSFLKPASELKIGDPRHEATRTLMAFFSDECKLLESDAHQRTGEIFVALGWRDPQTRVESSTAIRREKEAVRKRHARARRKA